MKDLKEFSKGFYSYLFFLAGFFLCVSIVIYRNWRSEVKEQIPLSSCANPLIGDSREAFKKENDEQVQIISWSTSTSSLILLSSFDLKLEDYALRQGQTKKLESLKNISLQANEPTTIHVSKGFLNKKENEIILVKFLEVDRKKDF